MLIMAITVHAFQIRKEQCVANYFRVEAKEFLQAKDLKFRF